MDTGASPVDGLFDESLVERVEAPAEVSMDANGGVNKRFRSFEPDAVILVPPLWMSGFPKGIWHGSSPNSSRPSWT